MANGNRFGAGCCCDEHHDPPCDHGRACVTFIPKCSPLIATGTMPAIENPEVTISFTPDDEDGDTAEATCSSFTCCVDHVGVGTVAWTFASSNYLPQSGSFRVPECGRVNTNVGVYPNTLKVCVFGCNIARDGTEVTISLSGSGDCTPTFVHDPIYGDILCCDIPVTTAPPAGTLTVTADRYKKLSQFGASDCRIMIVMGPADGYFCCDPTGSGLCKPVSNDLILSTPLGDIPFTFGSLPASITATVLALPMVATSVGSAPACGVYSYLNREDKAVDRAVTFYLINFSCGADGWAGTFAYTGCDTPDLGACLGPGRSNSAIAQADECLPFLSESLTGIYTFHLSGACPPGIVGGFLSEGCPNRYLSGAFVLTEA